MDLKIQSLSKAEIKKHKPKEHERTILISIQDGEKRYLPFKERTNHITRRRYKDILFLYFDDLTSKEIQTNPYQSFIYSDDDNQLILNFLQKHYDKQDFDKLLIHCEAGMSRSHAIALFTAKYFEKDEKLYNTLLHQENKIFGGNDYIYEKLENEMRCNKC